MLVDDRTRLTWVHLLKSKTKILDVIKNFFSMVRNQFRVSIKRFRSDNTKDYFNTNLASFFRDLGVVQESSCVKTPQQNGLAERKIGHLVTITRALMRHQHVPTYLLGEAILTAIYLSNWIPSKVLGYESPIDLISKAFPDIKLKTNICLRVFGCTAFVHVHESQDKLKPRAVKCVFVGYSSTQKGDQCYHPGSKKFFVSADVTSHENESFFSPIESDNAKITMSPIQTPQIIEPQPIDIIIPKTTSIEEKRLDLNAAEVPRPTMSHEDATSTEMRNPNLQNSEVPSLTMSQEETQQVENESADLINETVKESVTPNAPIEDSDQGWPIALRKDRRACTQRNRYPMSNFMTYALLSSSYRAFAVQLQKILIPSSVIEAKTHINWCKAMNAEMDTLLENETWELKPLPQDKRTVGCRRVFTVKYHSNGSLERYYYTPSEQEVERNLLFKAFQEGSCNRIIGG